MVIRMLDTVPATVRETTGERIRRLRGARGWSQARLAEEANLDQQTISHVERGNEPKVSSLEMLADALGVTMDYLWRGGVS